MPVSTLGILSALSLGVLAAGSGQASATLLGAVVHGRFLYPDLATVDADAGTQTISSGTNFTFNDAAGGDFLTVAFSNAQVSLTNLTPGIFPAAAFDGVDLAFLSGPAITSVAVDPSSSPLFAPGSVLAFSSNDIRVNLSGTCATCAGGERIILDVATAASAVPEPASAALLGAGVLGLAWRRRKAA